jgi:hypothetical protein
MASVQLETKAFHGSATLRLTGEAVHTNTAGYIHNNGHPVIQFPTFNRRTDLDNIACGFMSQYPRQGTQRLPACSQMDIG